MTASPDVAGVIRAYRTWRYAEGALHSMMSASPWPPVLSAVCNYNASTAMATGTRLHPAAAPQAECGCGVYGCRTPELLIRQLGYYVRRGYDMVWGEVDLWGRVEVHEWGFRAEFARPAVIYLTDGRMRALARKLDLPSAIPPYSIMEMATNVRLRRTMGMVGDHFDHIHTHTQWYSIKVRRATAYRWGGLVASSTSLASPVGAWGVTPVRTQARPWGRTTKFRGLGRRPWGGPPT